MRNAPNIEVSIEPEGSPKVRVDMSDSIISMSYEDCENKADKLSLVVDNHDLSHFDDPIWRHGNKLHVSWGYAEAMSITRICQIRKISGFKELTIEALGREVELNVETKVRAFEGSSRSDVARQIAAEWGFKDPTQLHIQDTKRAREHITQARQTDAQLLRRLASKEGFEWYIDHDGFHFHERNFLQRSLRSFSWFDDPDRSEIQSITVESDVTKRAGSVAVKSHSPIKRNSILTLATQASEKERAVLAAVVEAPGLTEKNRPGYKSVAHHEIITSTDDDEEGAARTGSAAFRNAQHRAVKLTMEVEGDPNVYAKSIIELRGVGKRLSQNYYVRTVTHSIRGAYTMTLECVSDGSGGHTTKSKHASNASAVQVGPAIVGKKGPSTPTVRNSILTLGNTPKALEPVTNPDGSKQFVPPNSSALTPPAEPGPAAWPMGSTDEAAARRAALVSPLKPGESEDP